MRLVSTFRDTDTPGIYQVRLHEQGRRNNQEQRLETRLIAYNVPVRESEFELASNKIIRSQIGEDVRVEIQAPGKFNWLESKDADQEIRNWLLILLLTALLAEQLLAYRLSYHAKTTEALA